MPTFRTSEKPLQTLFKHGDHFSAAARADGIYKNHAYPFCLPRECAAENLFAGIRQDAIDYFTAHAIQWHDGQDHNPSHHLCDSQVCCVNFLDAFAHQPRALAALLKPRFPDLAEMLPVEDGRFVAFEWIGDRDYLHEQKNPGKPRSRGANFTSADAAVRFKRLDGSIQVVLIEWKYTESYAGTDLQIAASGVSRADIYRYLFEAPDCPLDKTALPAYEALFFEPFYQLMRQQFLAHEMEKARELGVDMVSLMHISPAHNQDFRRVTSPRLRSLGESATGVWQRLVKDAGRFIPAFSEELFGRFDVRPFPELRSWWEYITGRYVWVRNS
ncbi:hypothetical protein LARV_00818 [Longilinea arvoryzae]|uniref:Uncharacterized protein n=1 Tax=Longilinea arvoryzae TaxID=360412 RepID=A0A0S7BE21_9CHLR|nr:hypothetical protein [Longilinea arvoryzae]GAP13076.1 hypothetical protein LARV_00818 [Longilinea arvoryzae]